MGSPLPHRAADRGAPVRVGRGHHVSRSPLGALRPRRGGPVTAAGRNARAIKGDLKTLATDVDLAANADVARLQRRIVRHLPEMVTFITNPDLEGTNSRSEREFRPHAFGRHRSGARSDSWGRPTRSTSQSCERFTFTAAASSIPSNGRASPSTRAVTSDALPPPARDARQVAPLH
nr:transposase [Deltaproteobacteria bacterium]